MRAKLSGIPSPYTVGPYGPPAKSESSLTEELIFGEGNGPTRVADCELVRETNGSMGSERKASNAAVG